jgi:hypothetical protein
MGIVGNLLSPEKFWLQRIANTARPWFDIFRRLYTPRKHENSAYV